MRYRLWLAAGLAVLLSLPPLTLSAGPAADMPGDGRAGTPWYDAGWKCRAPVVIDNTKNTKPLSDFQVALDIPYDRDMKADFSDLRFVQYDGSQNRALPFWLETREPGKKARAYINVSSIAASSSTTIQMYFGNPDAQNASDGPSTFLFFDDFEDGVYDTSKWGALHACDAGVTLSEAAGMLDFSVSGSYQWTGGCIVTKNRLPNDNYVIETRLKFTNYYQSAFGAYAGFTNETVYLDDNYGNPLDLVSARLWDYTKNGWYLALSADDIGNVIYGNTNINIRNIWYRMKTYYTPGTYAKGVWNMLDSPFTNQSMEMTGSSGIDPNYIILGVGEYNTAEHTYFDHLLLRKYASPEPELSVGEKERPYSFKSFSAGPEGLSEGDAVTLTAVMDNPIDLAIPVNITFKEGDDYADAAVLEARQVLLEPRRENEAALNLTAEGGNHTYWFVLEGSPLASASVEVNWVPTMDYIPNQLLMQAIPFSLHITARDKDGDPLNWTEDSDLFDFKRTDGKGADIAFVPSNDDVGSYVVNFTVTDPRGRSASRSANFTVQNSNDNPVIDAIPDMSVPEDAPLRYQVNATDPDLKWGDSLRFSDDTTLFDIDPVRGNFTFVPVNEQVGRYTIEITVADNQSATAVRRFTLTVVNINDPPSVDPIAPQKATQDRLWQVMVTARDPDQDNSAGDKLRFSDDSPLFDIDPASGLAGFKPANGDVGVHTCNITVTDLAGAKGTAVLTLTVANVNDPPALSTVDDQTAVEDQPFELALRASDIDVPLRLDNLTFHDDSPLFDVDPQTGAISFTPSNAEVGRHTIRVWVTDESNATASRTFLLTVQNVNDPPEKVAITSLQAGARFRQGEPIWFNATALDVDAGDRLAYVWLDNGVEFAYGRTCQTVLAPGKHLITLDVSDGKANTTAEVEITVARKDIPVSVAGHASTLLPAVAAVAVIAVVAAAALAMTRRRRKPPQALPPEAEKAVPAAAPAPEATPPSADDGHKAEAEKAVGEAEESLADAIVDGRDTSTAEADLSLAREAMKEEDFAMALTFAAKAREGLGKAPPAKAQEDSKPAVGRLKCPQCDEELQPEWPACPVCGYKTRGD